MKDLNPESIDNSQDSTIKKKQTTQLKQTKKKAGERFEKIPKWKLPSSGAAPGAGGGDGGHSSRIKTVTAGLGRRPGQHSEMLWQVLRKENNHFSTGLRSQHLGMYLPQRKESRFHKNLPVAGHVALLSTPPPQKGPNAPQGTGEQPQPPGDETADPVTSWVNQMQYPEREASREGCSLASFLRRSRTGRPEGTEGCPRLAGAGGSG